MIASGDDSTSDASDSSAVYHGERENEGLSSEEEEFEEKGDLVPVYNGKVLDVSEKLLRYALSGISVRHYDGCCLPPKEEENGEDSGDVLVEEGYVFDTEWSKAEEDASAEKEPSLTMSSAIKLCYRPKNRGSTDFDNVPEERSLYFQKPLCVQDKINFRNSFWNLHRPELCKLTWPHEYVSDSTVTEHLHRHLLSHGSLCSAFHDDLNMRAVLNKELDLYDKLKEILPPRAIPSDDKPFGGRRTNKTRNQNPCKQRKRSIVDLKIWNDESDLDPYQSVHTSKEEFCITIGKPARQPTLREKEPSDVEPEEIWSSYEDFGVCEEYPYAEYYVDSIYCQEREDEDEGEEREVREASGELTSPRPSGWTEPDFCAMI